MEDGLDPAVQARLGQFTCGCVFAPGELRVCRGHSDWKPPPGPSGVADARQGGRGVLAELAARGVHLHPPTARALQAVENRRARFRRVLRQEPDMGRSGVEQPYVPGADRPPSPRAGDSGRPLVTGVNKGIGLNATQGSVCERDGNTRFGNLEAEVADWAEAGASVVRQVGTVDLLWSFLPDPALGGAARGFPVPVDPTVVDPASTETSTLDGLILTEENIGRFADLLTLLHDRQIKVIFTFLTLGAGGGSAGELTYLHDPAEESAFIIREGASLNWESPAEEHMRTLFNGSVINHRGGPEWYLHAFDAGNGYHRTYAAAIAARAVKLLIRAMDRAFPGRTKESGGVRLGDIVAAIEIFNEVDEVGWYQEAAGSHKAHPQHSGRDWGRAWGQVARAMWDTFASTGPEDRVPLHLPGIASWQYEGEEADFTPRTWAYKKKFLAAMLDRIAEDVDRDPTGPSLPELVGGVDLHWYHKEVPGSEGMDVIPGGETRPPLAGYVHIGYLYLELQELRDLLDARGLDGASISVFETGMSTSLVHKHFPAAVKKSLDDAVGATDYIPENCVDFESEWQALELWRRMGTVLAGKSDAAGWHTWSSGPSPVFQGMGLRRDASSVGTDADGREVWGPLPLDAATSVSVTRPAWYAMQRIAQKLANHVLTGRMVLPAVDSRADLRAYLGGRYPNRGREWRSGYAVVVLEYEVGLLPAYRRYWYLVFVDPVFLDDDSETADQLDTTGARVQFRADVDGVVTWSRVATLPRLDSSRVSPGASGPDGCDDLPVRRAGFTPDSSDPFFAADASDGGLGRTWQDVFFNTSKVMATSMGSSAFPSISGSSSSPVRDLAPVLLRSETRLTWQVP